MKYVIFSDVHGNTFALKQMLKDVAFENIGGYIYCGDIAGYYYDQAGVVDILKKINNLLIVKGNHDVYYSLSYKDVAKKQIYSEKYGESYNLDISSNVIKFIHNLPTKIVTEIQGHKIGIFHGSPDDALNGRIYPDHSNYSNTFQLYDICFLGNTHYRLLTKVHDTIIINPGSLGQPRDGKGFSYCIFDFDTLCCEYKSVEFNKDCLIKKIINIESNERHQNYLINVLDRSERND